MSTPEDEVTPDAVTADAVTADAVAADAETFEELPAPRTLQEAAERIVYLETWVGDVDRALAATILKTAAPDAGAASRPQVPAGEQWEPFYGSLVEFVEEFFVVAFARTLGGQTAAWCTHWWDHTEAILRLEALWRTFEAARLEPVAGMANWLGGQLDRHLPVLLSGTGPFGQCRPDAHRPPDPLPVSPAPSGWFDPMTSTVTSTATSTATQAAS